MKNRHIEFLRRKARECYRVQSKKLVNGLYIPHLYPKNKSSKKLSWWCDVGFGMSGRMVFVNWRHPRSVYHSAIEQQALEEVTPPSKKSTFEVSPSEQAPSKNLIRRLGRSRKKVLVQSMPKLTEEWENYYFAVEAREQELSRLGINFIVTPSIQIHHHLTGMFVDLVAPIEVRNLQDVQSLARLAKRLLKRETSIADEWPQSKYGHDDWLAEKAQSPTESGNSNDAN